MTRQMRRGAQRRFGVLATGAVLLNAVVQSALVAGVPPPSPDPAFIGAAVISLVAVITASAAVCRGVFDGAGGARCLVFATVAVLGVVFAALVNSILAFLLAITAVAAAPRVLGHGRALGRRHTVLTSALAFASGAGLVGLAVSTALFLGAVWSSLILWTCGGLTVAGVLLLSAGNHLPRSAQLRDPDRFDQVPQ